MPVPYPVLLMVRRLSLGGSERQLTEIARKLNRARFSPHVATFHPSGLRAAELAAAGVPVVCLEIDSFLSFSAVRAFHRLSAYIRRHSIRLVHTFDSPANIYGVPAVRAGSPAAVLSSQRAHRKLTPVGGRQLLRITDRLVDGIVVNCEFLRQHLIQDEKVPKGMVHLCHNGLDLEAFRPEQAPRPAVLADASLVVGVICALRPEKSLETLIETFARVKPLRPGLKLLIVGCGPCLPELQRLAAARGLTGDCIFEPATAEVAAWLQAIDIFVLPSRSEALSNSLMEAMACGCCAVASRVGGNPELVTDRKTGLLFEPVNIESQVAALRLLIEQDALRKELAAAGMAFVRATFSLEASARRMEEIYSALLA